MPFKKIHFHSAGTDHAQHEKDQLIDMYGQSNSDDADIIVSLGGDGTLLQAFHKFHELNIPFYGVNLGTVGFLLNPYDKEQLCEHLDKADSVTLHPLKMEATCISGNTHRGIAFNEVSFMRQTHNASKLSIHIDGKERLDELICDGILISTPAGSTAYNLSANGPILPLSAELLSLTPISAFRPRRWRGALLKESSEINIKIHEHKKRPVSVSADQAETRNVTDVKIWASRSIGVKLLTNPDYTLEERVLKEQFFP